MAGMFEYRLAALTPPGFVDQYGDGGGKMAPTLKHTSERSEFGITFWNVYDQVEGMTYLVRSSWRSEPRPS